MSRRQRGPPAGIGDLFESSFIRCCSSKFTVTVRSMRSMRSMRGGIIFRNRGPSLSQHPGAASDRRHWYQCLGAPDSGSSPHNSQNPFHSAPLYPFPLHPCKPDQSQCYRGCHRRHPDIKLLLFKKIHPSCFEYSFAFQEHGQYFRRHHCVHELHPVCCFALLATVVLCMSSSTRLS